MPDAPVPPLNVKSADRVLTLFELLGTWGREMSHTDIADALSILKSSLTHLLKTMVGRGWLTYSPSTKGYALGPAFSRLARRSGQAVDLVAVAWTVWSSPFRTRSRCWTWWIGSQAGPGWPVH